MSRVIAIVVILCCVGFCAPSLWCVDTRVSVQTHLTSFGVSPTPMDLETIDAMRDAGVSWVRHWVFWYQVEHDSGVYDWTHQDSIIYAYMSRGINVYVTLMGGNQFYDPDTVDYQPDSLYPRPEFGLPPGPGSASHSGWLDFVGAIVNRYKDIVKYWSIWNEPNLLEFWPPNPDPGDYSYLVATTSDLIKSIDSTACIIGSNLSMIDLPFFSQIADSIIPYIDYVGYHPYRLFPEDDQQNFLYFLPEPFPPEDSLFSFEEELSALIDSIRLRDPQGRVGLWDDESGYPSHPEPILWEPISTSSEITQSKYLLRKHLLSFAFNVRVSNWWWDFDIVSGWFNALGENWFTHFYDLQPQDWLEKQNAFLFNYIGLTYAPHVDTVLKEAEDYDTLTGWWEDSGEFISLPDTAPAWDPGTYARYTIPIPSAGLYTLWMSMRNPDSLEVPVCIAMVDSLGPPYYFMTTVDPSDTARFIWTFVGESESLRVTWWYKGPHYFDLGVGAFTLYLAPGPPGTQVDKIVIKREGTVSEKKGALTALDNLTDIFGINVEVDTVIWVDTENIDLDSSDYAELRVFSFEDTSSSEHLIAYWVGKEAVDSYPQKYLRLSVAETVADSATVLDLLTGVASTAPYNLVGDTLVFDSLKVSDSPKVLILLKSVGVEEASVARSVREATCFPNPVRGKARISFSLTSPSVIEFSVYDVSGRLVATPCQEKMGTGTQEIECDMKDLSSGVYFWTLTVGKDRWNGKLVVLR